MKKLFWKRHLLFFITLLLLAFCELLIVRNYIHTHRMKIIQIESIAALRSTLSFKRKNLPDDHIYQEQKKRSDLLDYKKFISQTWPKLLQLPHIKNAKAPPPNHIAMFFVLSDYMMWAKENCDAFGIEFDSSCSFGLQDLVEKNDERLMVEIGEINQQKEQLKMILSHLMESKSSYVKILSLKRKGTPQGAYFDSNSLFVPEVKTLHDTKSYVYRLKFSAFSDTFRNWLKAMYVSEIPLIFREISVTPNFKVNLTRTVSDQILECLPSTFSVIIEFPDCSVNLGSILQRPVDLQK